MCGRFTLHTEKELLAKRFEVDLDAVGPLAPRYNIAPSQDVLVVRMRDAERLAMPMRWGLVPHWAKPLEKLPPMINARRETLAEKPAFRDSLRRRRCLVLADGFYEWQSVDRRVPRQPFWISLADAEPFAMAGIWDVWFPPEDPDAEPLRSCSIVTAPANLAIQMIHPRMPVILPLDRAFRWLDPELDDDPDALLELLEPVAANALASHPVCLDVNSPEQDDAHLIEPVPHPSPTLF
jgi:putative SOS response-associated peptidase YedK